MRILAVTPYYEREGGGLERYAHATLSRLAARGHEVEALAFSRLEQGVAHQDGVTVQRFRPSFFLGNAPVSPRFASTVEAEIAAFGPDLVVAHTPVPFPAEMACLAARRRNVPFVLTYHAGRLRGSSPLLDGLAAVDRLTAERAMLSAATGLVAVGPYVRDHALQRHLEKVAVVAPGVDGQTFRPHGEPEGKGILFVGPLSRNYRWKGLDVLLRAFPEVVRRVPAATLTLVGDGDRSAALRAHAARSGGRIRVLPRLDTPGLVAEYQRAAVTTLPSTTDAESFGMVLAEANACARPVVASRVGGIPDFVHEGVNGLLAAPGDAHGLAERLVTILRDADLADRLGQRGRKRVLADHDWDRLTVKTEQVLQGAAAA